jgi:hypothetical protein
MHPDDLTPAVPEDEAAKLIQEMLDPIALSPLQREALLRRILGRTGSGPLAPPPRPD